MQVGIVVDPTAKGIGCIGARDVLCPCRARGACRNIARVANPVHAAQTYDGALGPVLYQGLAALVPIAFKTVDKGELRRNLRGEFAGVLKGKSPSTTCTSQLASILAGRVRWSVETMTRQPAAAAARTLSSNEACPSENEV